MSASQRQVGASGEAIVIGAGMAGLLAARVLADHFAKVTVIEKDDPLDDAEPRKGVPQGAHAHALLSRGLEILSGRFPGLIDELLTGGAVQADAATVAWHQRGVWKLRVPSEIRGTAQSRPFLEAGSRSWAATDPGVTFLSGRKVGGLLTNDNRTR